MKDAHWDLPGPAGWLDEALDRLGDGMVVLEIQAARSAALPLAFEKAAHQRGFASTAFVRLQPEHLDLPVVAAILEGALSADDRPARGNMEAIVNNQDMEGIVVWVEVPAGKAADGAFIRSWSSFCGAFLEQRERSSLLDPPAIVIAGPRGMPAMDRKLPVFRFENRVGRDDARLVFGQAGRGRQRSRLERLLGAELVVELAGWDLIEVERLAGIKLEKLLDPDVLLALGEQDEAGDGHVVSDLFEDRSFPSLSSLEGAAGRDEIEHRVWRAQVRGLFPWLEEIRQIAIRRFSGKFQLPLRSYDNQVISSPEDLEWGQMEFSLRGRMTQSESRLISVMKNIRNKLAHRKPVEFDALVECEQLVREFIAAGK